MVRTAVDAIKAAAAGQVQLAPAAVERLVAAETVKFQEWLQTLRAHQIGAPCGEKRCEGCCGVSMVADFLPPESTAFMV